MTVTLRDRAAELAAAPVLFINQGGRIVCTDPDHAGYALSWWLEQVPDVEEVNTSLGDHWERLTAAEVVDFAVGCEDCAGESR